MLRILVMVNNIILGEAIENLFSLNDDCLVMRMLPTVESKLALVIDRFQPAVIIIEESVAGVNPEELDVTSADPGYLRVITISSEQNEVAIKDIYRVPVAGLGDLAFLAKSAASMLPGDLE